MRGHVVEELTNVPLEGASVSAIINDSTIYALTNVDGVFRFPKIKVGRYNLIISYMGYETIVKSDLLVTAGKESVVDIALSPSYDILSGAVVKSYTKKDRPLNKLALVSARSFSVEETSRYAGGMADPARMATAFAGVSGGDMQDNALSVRGNSPRNISWRLEGIDIPSPNHFTGANVAGGGFVSLLSSQVITNSDFITGAFPAEFGNTLGGVFDIKMRTGNNEKRETAIQICTMGVEVSSEGPISKKDNSSYLFNYRYSTMGLLAKAKVIPGGQVPKFQDLIFKINFPTKKNGVFSLWGIAGRGEITEPYNNDSTAWKSTSDRIGFDWVNMVSAFGINHKKYAGNSTSFSTSIVFSNVKDKFDFIRLDDEMVERPYLNIDESNSKITFSHNINYQINPKLNFKAGLNVNSILFDMDIYSNKEPEDFTTYSEVVKTKGNTFLIEGYANMHYLLNKNIVFSFGVHSNYFFLNNDFSLEPRISTKWNINEKHSLSLGYGNHSQIEPLKLYFVKTPSESNNVFPNKDLGFSRAHHVVLAHDWLLSDKIRLKTELYYQRLYNVPGIPDSSYSVINYKQEFAFRDILKNNSVGQNIGIEFTFERFFNNNYYYLLTASIFNSKYKGDDNIWRNSRYDKGSVFNILAGKDFIFRNRNLLSFNLRLSYVGGERCSPILTDESLAQRKIVFNDSRLFEDKYPADIFTDLSISYRKNKKRHSSVFSAQIKNVLGNKTRRGYFFNYQTKKLEEDSNVVVVPLISYKLEF